MAQFVRTSAAFLFGLIVAIGVTDYRIGQFFRHRHGDGLIGAEVYQAIRRAQNQPREVKIVFLGDSVARQLLPPGSEPRADVRFLTTNQAISLAGQFGLLRTAFDSNPGIQEVYLLYIPGCFGNNLPPRFSHDYYCGYFHRFSDVLEVFQLKHDVHLSAAHLGHFLMPNLMLANTCWNTGGDSPADNSVFAAMSPSAPEPEPVLSLLEKCLDEAADPPEPPAGTYGTSLPPVSRHFLEKMSAICRSHAARLHIIPCPLSSRERFEDREHLFGTLPMRVDPSLLIDAVHFNKSAVDAARKRMIAAYHLPLEQPSGRIAGK